MEKDDANVQPTDGEEQRLQDARYRRGEVDLPTLQRKGREKEKNGVVESPLYRGARRISVRHGAKR